MNDVETMLSRVATEDARTDPADRVHRKTPQRQVAFRGSQDGLAAGRKSPPIPDPDSN
jgi:hypothetical protein